MPRRTIPALGLAVAMALVPAAQAHIIPPERLHPAAEAYRRAAFLLGLNPVRWEEVRRDALAIAAQRRLLDPSAADLFTARTLDLLDRASPAEGGEESLPRAQAAGEIFRLLTREVGAILRDRLARAGERLDRPAAVRAELREAQAVFAAFEDTVRACDPKGFARVGACFLEMSSAAGSEGLLGSHAVPADRPAFARASGEVVRYLEENYGDAFDLPPGRRPAPWPSRSPTFDPAARPPVKLPPGAEINKQIPRPRQILNMVSRGVDEGETPLIALGDMAFDSAYVLGEPSRSFGITCNTCHNKGVTNPKLFIPGLSARPGGADVSSSFLAPHANNGLFDPLDIPDLRGLRFTAPYGRNGRTASLRDFVRNGIVNEFNGDEPDPLLLDGLVAYLNEFDFLPNPALKPDGTLSAKAPEAARRGEKVFHRPFPGMAGRSCATCHVPSSQFLDHQRHDIGTLAGAEDHSLDRALDTPTLLGAKWTPPYFHDGSAPTLRSVVEWFDAKFSIGLSAGERDDLTAYLETVGDGVEAYEDTPYYLDAEMEEFSFFLSAYEFLEEKNKPALMDTTFRTIALEIQNHKWELQDRSALPVMERLAGIMEEAYAANQAGERERVRAKVREYRELYRRNVERLR